MKVVRIEMAIELQNYQTSRYDDLPVPVMIYQEIVDEQGGFLDYEIVYANGRAKKEYEILFKGDKYEAGKLLFKMHLMDEYSIKQMRAVQRGEKKAFSTYIPEGNMHVHMEPLLDLPAGYVGFFITNIADFKEQESKVHFLRVVYQMNNIACLYEMNADGTLTTVYATPSFCEMMECSAPEDVQKLMDGDGIIVSTYEEDRQLVREMLKNRVGPEGTPDLTIRKVGAKGSLIWCNAHYAFIDDYKEHYVYCTYANVSVLKNYEAQLQSIYTNLGQTFFQASEDTLMLMRANLTQNVVEECSGSAGYAKGRVGVPYTQALSYRLDFLPIEKEREELLDIFSIPSLTKTYMDGGTTANAVLYTRLPNDTVSYVKIMANVTRHPMTGDLVVFIVEESNNPEKLASTIQGKILAKQFDLVAYIARDTYDVAIGDGSLIRHGNIFPRKKHGSYREYLEEQIIPALRKDEAYREQIRKAMSLETVFQSFAVREPYSVDIEVEMEDGVFYKRFDFYSVDPESEYCIVLKTDTTELLLEQKKQEEKAKELEKSKRELADAEDIIAEAGFGMWHIEFEEGKEPRMRGNAKMMELLGIGDEVLTEEEIYKHWYSRILPEDVPSVEKNRSEMIVGKLSENTYRWNHPQKGLLSVRCGGSGSLMEEHKHLLRGYHSDVTAIVKDDMAQKEALADALAMAEYANRAKTAFLNNMSHDIRTPMNAIVGFTALASSHIDNKEQVQDYLGKITVSSQHLLSLINDVLDMSRIESGKMTLEEAPVHLPDVIHDLRTIIQANAAAKQLKLHFDTEDVKNEDIITDKLRLNQVFLNILSNAIKFTPNGGTISFRVIEKLPLSEGVTAFEFRIKDTGIGMSQEFQKSIFEAFTREKTSTVSGIQGTGLGMAITKSIVDMMGGSIYVNSEVGKGTEFVVSIPCRLPDTPTSFEPVPELSGLRALVVDDDTNTCLSLCTMLTDIGMRPDWACSGNEAVIRAKQAIDQKDAFQFYIVDWMMPDMNGLETVRRIRKAAGSRGNVIILTAYDWADIEVEAREAGVSAFCSKPLFLSELKNVLTRPFYKQEEEPEEEEKIDFSGKRILLAEDNEMNQMIAQAILTEFGFEVEIACDGEEAVRMMEEAKAGTYDVILMDIQMPKMDGYEAAGLIRNLEEKEKAQIPIIAVTANAFEEDRRLALEAGMNGHLAKPYDIPKMIGTLKEILG